MARKPKAVSKNKIPLIASDLKAKAATPITVTIEDLVRSLAQPIQEMLSAGYSYEDVAAVFANHGVELAASSIKSYHKKSQKKPPLSDSTQPEAEASPATEEENLPDQPEPLPEKSDSAKSKFNVTDRRKI